MPKRISRHSRDELLSYLNGQRYNFLCRHGSVREILTATPDSEYYFTTEMFDELYTILRKRKFPPVVLLKIIVHVHKNSVSSRLKPMKSKKFSDFHIRYSKSVYKYNNTRVLHS
jgi:hypothetical protein